MSVWQCGGGSTEEWHRGGSSSSLSPRQSLPSEVAETRPDHNLPSSQDEHFPPSPDDHLLSSEVEHLPSSEVKHLPPSPDDHLATRSRGAEQSLHEHNRPHDRSAACTERTSMKRCRN